MATGSVKWVCGTVVLLAFLGVGTTAWIVTRLAAIPGQMTAGLLSGWPALASVVHENRIEVTAGVSAIHAMRKLVVLEASVDVDVERSSTKRWLHEAVYLGTTTVRVKAKDNRVQYYIPLMSTDASDVTYDPAHNLLKVRVPRPELDRSMVCVQSDPSKIELRTDVGWASLDMFAGERMRSEVKSALRDEVVRAAGNSPLVREKAETLGREILTTQLSAIMGKTLGRDVCVEVEWQ